MEGLPIKELGLSRTWSASGATTIDEGGSQSPPSTKCASLAASRPEARGARLSSSAAGKAVLSEPLSRRSLRRAARARARSGIDRRRVPRDPVRPVAQERRRLCRRAANVLRDREEILLNSDLRVRERCWPTPRRLLPRAGRAGSCASLLTSINGDTGEGRRLHRPCRLQAMATQGRPRGIQDHVGGEPCPSAP